MNKNLITAIILSVPGVVCAQSAVDAYTLSQTDMRGTARFMSMGGAFTALGGDLSTLTQNPAGIGVYRRSEIGATLDISPRSISARTSTDNIRSSRTKVSCNNFGYIGTANLNGVMNTFSWGASYNRAASFNRKFRAYEGRTMSSLSNYVADYTTMSGVKASNMNFENNYNPYYDSDIDWLSILSYSAYMINPVGDGYRGLWQDGTAGDAYTEVYENGYVDEYSIDFGGNVANTLMWGIGFGITDLQYNSTVYYDESMADAYVATASGNMTTGDAGFNITNYRSVSGTGFNLKFGLIFKPFNELRIGAAIHTPTWYTLSSNSMAEVGYSYFDPSKPESDSNPLAGSDYTENSYYNFKMNAPWKFMVGVAGVLGSSAIISADYEYQAYNDMRVSYQSSFGEYISDDYVNDDIKYYYKAANIFRVGAEFRVTPSFSVRAGYNYTSTNCRENILDGTMEVLTAGTDPSYVMNRGVNAVSFGLGYRYKAFYIDGAFVYRNKKSTYKAYTNYGNVESPKAFLTENTYSVVLSAGFKF